MSYILCFARTNRKFSELDCFLKKYLTCPLGFIQHVYSEKLERHPFLYYISISEYDYQGMCDHYNFDTYSEEEDIQITEVAQENVENYSLSITLPDYESIIYRNQALSKMKRMVDLKMISTYDIKFSPYSCIISFNNDSTMKERFYTKTVLHHTLWYDFSLKISHICIAKWITPFDEVQDKFRIILKSRNILRMPTKNIKLLNDFSDKQIK